MVGGRGNGRGLGIYPCCYEDVVVPPQLSPDEVLGVDAQDEEDGGENGEGPVDGEDGAAAVFVGTRGELLGRGAHAGHGDDVARGCRSVSAGLAVSTLDWRRSTSGTPESWASGWEGAGGWGGRLRFPGRAGRRQFVDVQKSGEKGEQAKCRARGGGTAAL